MTTVLSSDAPRVASDSVHKSPKLWRIAHTTLENDARKAVDWLKSAVDADDRILLYVENIPQQDAASLEVLLYREGYRPMFDWYCKDQTAIFYCRNLVGCATTAWLTEIGPQIQKELDEIAVCGRPVIWSAGSGTISIPGVGSYSPNQKYCFELRFESSNSEGESSIFHRFPKVVLEVIAGQPRELAMRKVWQYLHYSDGEIHAVIVLAASYPIPLDSTFKAVIEVWRREPTGDLDLDFPLEDCDAFEHDCRAPTQHPSEESRSPNLFGLTGTATDETPSWTDVFVPEGETSRIVRYSDSVVVLDESLDDQATLSDVVEEPALKLSTFDFLRVCSRHEEAALATMAPIPLTSLKKNLVYALKRHRHLANPSHKDDIQQSQVSYRPPNHVRLNPSKIQRGSRQIKK
ncbi:transcription factor tau subunit sfc4 [Ceratobasidium sp. AG-Ba]|nr:transcription factor tau subunit sfc4 [Ceratobasidium sp. AG-Ba]